MKPGTAELRLEDQRLVEEFLEEVLARTRLPGISIAMAVNGRTLAAARGVSSMNSGHAIGPRTGFTLGCLNKFFLALAVLDLAVKNKLHLDQPLAASLPELAGPNGGRILVRHLLNHSAGYQEENLADPDIFTALDYRDFAASFNRSPLLFEPGQTFSYSHSPSALLARHIARAAGMPAHRYIRRRFLEPLAIRLAPGHGQAVESGTLACSRFWSETLSEELISMPDLAALGQALIQGARPFSLAILRAVLAPSIRLPALFLPTRAEDCFFQFGLGCARYPNGSYGLASNFQGHSLAFRFDPARRIVLAVAVNAEAPYSRDFVLNKLFNALLPVDAPELPGLCPRPRVRPPLEELPGRYTGARSHSLYLVEEADCLVLRPGHNPAVSQDLQTPLLRFQRDAEGFLSPLEEAVPLPVGFFPADGDWHLMLGNAAYRRERRGPRRGKGRNPAGGDDSADYR